MESEFYLCHEETIQLMKILNSASIRNEWDMLDEIGLQWVYQRGQYQIMDKKKWFIGKIKYGI